MLAIERQREIVEKIDHVGVVYVKELAEEYNVSRDTIRNDLTILENQQFLIKTYGGAIKKGANIHENAARNRIDKNVDDKKIIAKKALNLIKPNSVIYLDFSTTCIYLAELIKKIDFELIVVTTMIEIMEILSDTPNVELILVGGKFNKTKEGFVGALTNEWLDKFNFDIAFMGSVGIDDETNKIYTYEIEDALTKSFVISHSIKSYVLLESRKCYLRGNKSYAQFNDIDGLIVEKDINKMIKHRLSNYDIEII